VTTDDRSIAEDLTDWGKVVLLETIGRTSGRPAKAAVGFIAEPDGSLLVAAGSNDSDWALNLSANPACRATIGDKTTPCVAEEVDDDDRSRAITGLILKYGTPAERLGRGPVFRLVPLA
jgi:deazaflavin-dependent oxidoreductase (nitroreductase family)